MLPIVNIIILYKHDQLKAENLTKRRLFSSDNVESYLNYLLYKRYQISLIKGKVHIGKDGYLFLGNDEDNVVDKIMGRYPYTHQKLKAWVHNLKTIQHWYTSRGIKFLLVIAPNKHTIYQHELPDDIAYASQGTITDDIVALSRKNDIHLLDLRSVLQDQRKRGPLYFKTDTHWNHMGAAIGFSRTIAYLNDHFYNDNIQIPDYTLSRTHRQSGDLARFLKIIHLLPKDMETDYDIHLKETPDACQGKIDENHTLEVCQRNHETPIMGDQYALNENPVNDEKLLLLCDSFGNANIQLFNATFQSVWKFHYHHINGKPLADFVEKHRPDIVIYQVVERALYNDDIVKSFE